VPYGWLVFGSEGRREQTLRTDQDNGLVYADPPAELRERAASYYARFAEAAIQTLVAVGFPPCPAGIMASNPRWCQPLAAWRECFRRWIVEATPEHVLGACIHFDLRALAGAAELEHALRGAIHDALAGHGRFLGLLARDVVDRRVPLTMLGRVAVHRSGPRRGAVDLKGGGCLQLVGAARVDALRLQVAETNTVDRLRAAAARGTYPEEEAREYTDAFQHLMRLRLVHQLERIAAGEPPDNHVLPARLSHADGVLLLDALKTVSKLQAKLRERFATDFA
jgi:CBS domain-containing protein